MSTSMILPYYLVRFLAIFITRIIYRLKIRGVENMPSSGPALMVSNHVTWIDALFLSAATGRRIRFMLGREIFQFRFIKPLFKIMDVIPVSPSDKPSEVVNALDVARKALEEGSVVCVFAEGAITRNGNMRDFKKGLELIVKNSAYPIIPVHIGGAWGSGFSYYYGRLFSVVPNIGRRSVSVQFGKPMRAPTTAFQVREAVQELSTEVFDILNPRGCSLARMFIRSARRNWFKPAVSDTTGKRLTYGRTLIAALAFSDELRKALSYQEVVGILLPACVGAALANVALTLMGKVSVNLNFTVSGQAFAAAIQQGGVKTVISSRSFLEKLGPQSSVQNMPKECKIIFLEDVALSITGALKLKALLKAVFVPGFLLGSGARRGGADPATIIFSSGSTGEPKGVVLSHNNIMFNIQSVGMLYHFKSNDKMCAFLPLFHSFGFTCSLWCPFAHGFSAHYHTNPLDVLKIAEMTRAERLTILLATPSFLFAHLRRTKPEDFASLRIVITGAEKLVEKMSDLFAQKFGIRPMEGYGATELSPVAALSLPDITMARVKQRGCKSNSVGHPLPGVAIRITHIETGERMPPGESGLLLVKGSNVMSGYLNMAEKTAEVKKNGWYNTGDIARVDEDGFVFLQDRLSRHSKIAGEMVPHGAIEEKYHQALGFINRVLVVGSAQDEKRGEQIIVFYLKEAGDVDVLRDAIARSDLPNLWKPKKENYCMVEELPMLASGKLDLASLRCMTRCFVEENN